MLFRPQLLSLSRAVAGHLKARSGLRLAYLSTNRTTKAGDAEPDSQPRELEKEQVQTSEEPVASAPPAEPAAAPAAEKQADFEAASAPSVAQLADLIAEKDVKLAEVTDKYRRALAEMENVRARSRRDVDNAYKYSIQGFAKDLLEVADNLNRALDNVDQTKFSANDDLKTLFEGLQMTESGLGKVFQKYGVEKMDLKVGAPFDPNFHTAIFQTESPDAAPGTISAIACTGYMFKDRVLRPAAVGTYKVASTAASSSQPESKSE